LINQQNYNVFPLTKNKTNTLFIVLRATLALSLFSMAIFLAIYAWLYTIIWHAYKFVKIGEVQQTMEREAQKMRNYEQMV